MKIFWRIPFVESPLKTIDLRIATFWHRLGWTFIFSRADGFKMVWWSTEISMPTLNRIQSEAKLYLNRGKVLFPNWWIKQLKGILWELYDHSSEVLLCQERSMVQYAQNLKKKVVRPCSIVLLGVKKCDSKITQLFWIWPPLPMGRGWGCQKHADPRRWPAVKDLTELYKLHISISA